MFDGFRVAIWHDGPMTMLWFPDQLCYLFVRTWFMAQRHNIKSRDISCLRKMFWQNKAMATVTSPRKTLLKITEHIFTLTTSHVNSANKYNK